VPNFSVIFVSLYVLGFCTSVNAETLSAFDAVTDIAAYSVVAEKKIHSEHIDTMDIHPTKPHLILTSAYDRYVRLTDTTDPENWKLVWEWRKPQQAFLAELPIEFNPKGTLIGFGDYKGRGYLFNSEDGSVVFDQFIGEAGDPNYNYIDDVYFSADGASVFFSRQEKIFEYEIKTSRLVFVYQGPINTSLKSITLLSDGRLFASSYGTSHVWNRGERSSTIMGKFPLNIWTNSHNDTVLLKSQWHTVQAGFDLYLLDVNSKTVVQKFVAASAPMTAFKFVKGDSVLIGCTHWGELGFYETRTGKVLDQYQMVTANNELAGCSTIAASSDGNILYFSTGRGSLRKMTN
jgi:WD40 repeat protein